MTPMIEPRIDERNERQHHELPAEKGPDHRQHLHVASTHALLAGIAVVRLADKPQDAAAGNDPITESTMPGGSMMLNKRPTTMPGRVIRFGKRWCSRSIAKRTMSAHGEGQPRNEQDVEPEYEVVGDEDRHRQQFDDGYRTEIAALHDRQRPPSIA